MNHCMRFEVLTVVFVMMTCGLWVVWLGTQCHIPGGSGVNESADSRHQVTAVPM
jgi:hypothetical protein